MSLVIALCGVAVLAVVMLVFVGTQKRIDPRDVAVAYELAWQRQDWSTLFDLSAKELRDGQARDEFVVSKRASVERATAPDDPIVAVEVDEVVAATDTASVITRLRTGAGSVRSRVLCERRNGRWQVVAHNLVADDA